MWAVVGTDKYEKRIERLRRVLTDIAAWRVVAHAYDYNMDGNHRDSTDPDAWDLVEHVAAYAIERDDDIQAALCKAKEES